MIPWRRVLPAFVISVDVDHRRPLRHAGHGLGQDLEALVPDDRTDEPDAQRLAVLARATQQTPRRGVLRRVVDGSGISSD